MDVDEATGNDFAGGGVVEVQKRCLEKKKRCLASCPRAIGGEQRRDQTKYGDDEEAMHHG